MNQLRKIKDVVLINPDAIKRGYPHQEIKYIDISSVGSGTLSDKILYHIKDAPSRAKRLVQRGDTIISTVRPNRRSFLFIKYPEDNLVVSTGFAVLRPTDKIDGRFLYYTITHQPFTDYLTLRAKGAAYPAVDTEIISDADIRVPELKEQHKIASILSAYDDLIENNTRRIQILEEMVQRIYKERFVDFRFPGHENVKMKESELGMIPEGWNIESFGDVFDIKYGKGLPTKKILPSGQYPVYGAGGVIGYFNESVINKKVTLITCRGNGSGTVWRTKEPAFVTNNSFLILPKGLYNHLEYHFIEYLCLNSSIKSVLSGSAQPQITISGLSTVIISIPPKKLIDDYCGLVRNIPEFVDTLYRKNEILRKTRDLLLPKLISGKIDVSEMDIDIGANAA